MEKREKLRRVIEMMEANEIEKGETGQFMRIHFGDDEQLTFSDGLFGELGLPDNDELTGYLDSHDELIHEGRGWWLFEPDPDTHGHYSPELAVEIIEEIASIMGYTIEDVTYVEGLDFKGEAGVVDWTDVEADSEAPPYEHPVTDEDVYIRGVFQHVFDETIAAEELPSPMPQAVFYDSTGQINYTLGPGIQTVVDLDDTQRERLERYVQNHSELMEESTQDKFTIIHAQSQSQSVEDWLEVFEFLRQEILDIESNQITHGELGYEGNAETIPWESISSDS